MRFRQLKGLLYINGVPHTYTVEGRLEPTGFTFKARLKFQTLFVKIAEEDDFNSPGIEEVNDAVINYITDQQRGRYERSTSNN